MPKPAKSTCAKPACALFSGILTPAVAELVAIGAAIAANCEPCFKYHYSQARKLGVSREEMAQTVALADKVKRSPAENMLTLADRLLRTNKGQQKHE